MGEVFLVFLSLGCRCFGGPVAHLGYFRRELVEKRRWCGEATYAELIGIAQSLPGPASSQVGFSLGLLRAGWWGGVAAWCGFTLPSAALMLAFASGHALFGGRAGMSLVHALQLVAVAVVAQAVLAMQRTLAPDVTRLLVAAVAFGIVMVVAPQVGTMLAIGLGLLAGLVLGRGVRAAAGEAVELGLSKRGALGAAICLVGLLGLLPVVARLSGSRLIAVAAAFYRSGALVFGGGHVLLPMLETTVVRPGWVSQPTFLAGYGAAQALPGPLFSFAAYLGAMVGQGSRPVLLGVVGVVAIFLPGLLAMAAVLPFWGAWRRNEWVRAGLWGINASVVGVLLAALCRPLWTSSVHTAADFVVVVAGFVALVVWKAPPWVVVLATVAVSLAVGFAGFGG